MASQEAVAFKVNIEVPKFNETMTAEEAAVFKVNIEAPKFNEIRAAEEVAVYKEVNKKYNSLMLVTVWSHFVIELTNYLQLRDAAKRAISLNAIRPDWTHGVPDGIMTWVLIGVLCVKSACNERTVQRNRRVLKMKRGFCACVWASILIRFVGFGIYFVGRFFATKI